MHLFDKPLEKSMRDVGDDKERVMGPPLARDDRIFFEVAC